MAEKTDDLPEPCDIAGKQIKETRGTLVEFLDVVEFIDGTEAYFSCGKPFDTMDKAVKYFMLTMQKTMRECHSQHGDLKAFTSCVSKRMRNEK